MGTERGIEEGDRPLKPPFENPRALALPCLALPRSALPRQGDSTSLELPRANTGKRSKRRKSHCDLRQ